MKSKADKLKRLVAVQRHMERMAEIELAGTTQAREEIAQKLDFAMTAIGSMDPIHAGLKTQYARQFGRLTNRDAQMAGLQEVQEQQVLREKAKADRLDEHRQDAATEEERERQDNAVLELLEIRLATPASSKLGET